MSTRRLPPVSVCAPTLVLLLAAAPAPALDVEALLASGDAQRQLDWARSYEHGEGVARDADTAVRLYCHAADAGVAEAGYHLGWMYANGRGVTRDDALAAAWFRFAAERGDDYAGRMLERFGEPDARADCVLGDGAVYRLPLESEPDPSRARIVEWVLHLAPRYALDPSLVLAVIRAESGFDPRARSPKDARGLMQLIPGTAARFGVADVWDPLDNLRGGMAYLRWLLDHFEGDEALALAGYNAGERAVRRYGRVPPYAETRAYVRRVARWRTEPPESLAGVI